MTINTFSDILKRMSVLLNATLRKGEEPNLAEAVTTEATAKLDVARYGLDRAGKEEGRDGEIKGVP